MGLEGRLDHSSTILERGYVSIIPSRGKCDPVEHEKEGSGAGKEGF